MMQAADDEKEVILAMAQEVNRRRGKLALVARCRELDKALYFGLRATQADGFSGEDSDALGVAACQTGFDHNFALSVVAQDEEDECLANNDELDLIFVPPQYRVNQQGGSRVIDFRKPLLYAAALLLIGLLMYFVYAHKNSQSQLAVKQQQLKEKTAELENLNARYTQALNRLNDKSLNPNPMVPLAKREGAPLEKSNQ